MKYLKTRINYEEVIRKSRFITVLLPFNNQSEFSSLIEQIKKEYPKATHYCTAVIWGDNAEYASSNDDGEPSGTAGIPMLEALKSSGATNLCAIVIRYYGGVKLGASGLIRSYRSGVTKALKLAEFYKIKYLFKYRIYFEYDKTNEINYLLSEEIIIERKFLDKVCYEIALNEETKINDFTHHLISYEYLGRHKVII